MSKFYTTSTAGIDVKFPGPSSVEEYDAKAGEGKCLEDAVMNEVWRGTLPEAQSKAMPRLIELTGVQPAVNEKQTEKNRARAKTPEAAAKVQDVLETFNSYVNRIQAQFAGDEEMQKAIVDTVVQVCLETQVDPSATSRAKGPGREFLDRADSILARPDEKIEESVSKIEAAWGQTVERDENGKPTRESLAHGIKAWLAAQL